MCLFLFSTFKMGIRMLQPSQVLTRPTVVMRTTTSIQTRLFHCKFIRVIHCQETTFIFHREFRRSLQKAGIRRYNFNVNFLWHKILLWPVYTCHFDYFFFFDERIRAQYWAPFISENFHNGIYCVNGTTCVRLTSRRFPLRQGQWNVNSWIIFHNIYF